MIKGKKSSEKANKFSTGFTAAYTAKQKWNFIFKNL